MSATRSLRSALVAALVVGSAALVPGPAAGADPVTCGGGGWMHDGGVSAGGWCAGAHPGHLDTTSVEVLWNTYCAANTGRRYLGTIEVEQPDGTVVTYTDDVSMTLTGTHPGLFEDPDLEFFFITDMMGWDPTAIIGHYEVSCSGYEANWASGGTEDSGSLHFTITDPVPVETLRDNALARIPFTPPDIGSAPPTGQVVVNLATWLWVDEPWVTLSDSDSQGLVTVDVFATPVDVAWTFDDNQSAAFAGDGEVLCVGPGEVWTPADGGASSDCQYTFGYPSAWNDDGVFHGTATMRWEASWSINGVDQGVFAEVTRTTAFDVNVIEIQTVGTRGG